MTDERTWNPGGSPVLPEVPEDAYPPHAVPLDEPETLTSAALLVKVTSAQRRITQSLVDMGELFGKAAAASDAMSAFLADHDRDSYLRIIDLRAGREHSRDGAVASCLAEILTLHAARVRAELAEEIAAMIEDHPGPNPSPAIPAWWAGYVESQGDMAKIAREHAGTDTP